MNLFDKFGLTLFPVISGVVSAGLLAVLLRFRKILPLDHPNDRSLHVRPVPRSGGVALVVGFSIVALFPPWHCLLGLAVFLALVSYGDDRVGLPVLVRFSSHLLAGVVFLFCLNSGLGFWTVVFLAFALVWSTNLFNFMDGADGLAGGMTVIGFGFYGAAAFLRGDGDLALFSWIISGAGAGFLFFNFPPARVFLGDAGSIPLGFLAGSLGMMGVFRGVWPRWFPVLVFGPFVADATVTLIRRMVKGRFFWEAHRSHYYQRLIQMGWSHRRTAFVEYGAMIFMGGVALALFNQPPVVQGVGILLVLGVTGLVLRVIDFHWTKFSEKRMSVEF